MQPVSELGEEVHMTAQHIGIGIIDGHPVPYSLTVSGAADGPAIRRAAEEWLARAKPDAVITRIDGSYVFYERRKQGQ